MSVTKLVQYALLAGFGGMVGTFLLAKLLLGTTAGSSAQSNPASDLIAGVLYFVVALLVVGTGISLVVTIYQAIASPTASRTVRAPQPVRTSSHRPLRQRPIANYARRPSAKAQEDAAVRQLMQEVLSLTRDKDVAQRLIDQAIHLNPSRSLSWCCEKVIYDLQRDRRA